MSDRMALIAGDRRNVNPTAATVSARSAAATMARASPMRPASGFSHSTCLPAASSPSTTSRCRSLPTTTLTASMSSASATAFQSVSARSNPNLRAVAVANGSCMSATATSRRSGKSGPATLLADR
jgi:BRCT domain type II-containing protein